MAYIVNPIHNKYCDRQACANRADPDHMLQNAAVDQDLYGLLPYWAVLVSSTGSHKTQQKFLTDSIVFLFCFVLVVVVLLLFCFVFSSHFSEPKNFILHTLLNLQQ